MYFLNLRDYPHIEVMTTKYPQDGTKKIGVRPYHYPHYHKPEMEKMVEDMLKSGVFRPSQSLFSSLMSLIRKGDGTWGFCVDYRT